ncbi:MAG: C40 family peptidase [Candidatus Dadabacteria bacterium]
MTIVFLIGAFTSISAQSDKQIKQYSSKTNVKFLEDITIEPTSVSPAPETSEGSYINPAKEALLNTKPVFASPKDLSTAETGMTVERAKAIQFKYSLLLDIEVELVHLNVFRIIDEWYGTRYQLGGISKSGIDCSALMQVFFTALYGISLPRTAREQFNFARRISRAELREGDLLFFNTRGGISHVGMYLANNRFVHASVNGVTITSLLDNYYSKRLVAVGRVDMPQQSLASARLDLPKP